jgi:Fe-S-cluster containining protein
VEACQPYLERLTVLFAAMDRKYAEVAGACGFVCQGCEDNCCATHFYHHTLAEYVYLLKGFGGLAGSRQQEIGRRAAQVRRQNAADEASGLASRRMCPLNADGRCTLYPFRPMICRLHGLPHVLNRPDGRRLVGPGCGVFTATCQGKGPVHLDRTPFYRSLAELEKSLRQALGIDAKFKCTIAQMLSDEICGRLSAAR